MDQARSQTKLSGLNGFVDQKITSERFSIAFNETSFSSCIAAVGIVVLANDNTAAPILRQHTQFCLSAEDDSPSFAFWLLDAHPIGPRAGPVALLSMMPTSLSSNPRALSVTPLLDSTRLDTIR